jgi:hypothetical protein
MKDFPMEAENHLEWENAKNDDDIDANGQTNFKREKVLPKTMDINEAHELGHKSNQLLTKLQNAMELSWSNARDVGLPWGPIKRP